MTNSIEKTFRLYDLLWGLMMPLLRRNHRLAEGFDERILLHKVPENADLWIQAASAGEAYLAELILKNLKPARSLRVLLTSNTEQGIEILTRAAAEITPNSRGITVSSTYFPFDRPSLMEKAVASVRPRVVALLETEIWPGLLFALKKQGSRVIILNGRMTDKSLKRYRILPSLWTSLKPDKILAVSKKDMQRFDRLFGKGCASLMPNMKFDRFMQANSTLHPPLKGENPLRDMLPRDLPFVVLGSTGDEEEHLIENMLLRLRKRHPRAVIGLFPRHLHRVKKWKQALSRMTLPWKLRSEIRMPVSPGAVILWDTFGELLTAYQSAAAAFVGGSLAPLGGQNFLEALTCGIIPVIGPFWETFEWVGQDIVNQGLVRVAGDWKAAADMLSENIESSPPRDRISELAADYVKNRGGGTAQACALIQNLI
jgi:3-deoxy-D-manno-octulosonic-acid transferase